MKLPPVKRRKALRNIGLGLSAGFVLPPWLSSCSEKEPGPEIEYDGVVAVIGAGAAGLLAADVLRTKGVEVIVLEATNRIGGRIRSIRQFENEAIKSDFPIELGAERILGTNSRWADAVDFLRVNTIEYRSQTTDNFFIDNNLITASDAANDPDIVAAKNFVQNLSGYNGPNVSVQQAITNAGLNTRVHAILNSWIGNFYGSSNSRMGITALAEARSRRQRNDEERVIRRNTMEDVLLSRFNNVAREVRINQVVRSIDTSGSRVEITISDTTNAAEPQTTSLTVDKVIVTVPVSILKANDITFFPALPAEKISAMSRIGMDASIRAVMEFTRNFWGNSSGFVLGSSLCPTIFNTGVIRSELNKTLSITINGPMAESLSNLGGIENEIVDELDDIFNGQASAFIIDNAVIQDWSKRTFIKGGVSYSLPGGRLADREILSAPVDEKLFFAGEATDHTGDHGTVSGALNSAERAAMEVIASILQL